MIDKFIDKSNLPTEIKELKNYNINPADLKDAFELLDCVAEKLKDSLGVDIKSDALKLEGVDLFDMVIKSGMSLISSKKVREATFKCLTRSLYKDSQNIDHDFFENEDRRKYFIPVMVECIRVNLSPFLSGAIMKLQELKIILKDTNTPESK